MKVKFEKQENDMILVTIEVSENTFITKVLTKDEAQNAYNTLRVSLLR